MSNRAKNTASVMTDEEAVAATGVRSTAATPKLQWVNIANLTAYLVNVLLVYGAKTYGNLPSDSEQSTKYQTLVTPSAYAFAIWAVINPAELVWAVAQMLPSYRSNEFVIHGVGYYFVLTCLAQASWSILFSTQNITWSLVAMLTILFSLLVILWKTFQVRPTTTSTTTPVASPSTALDEVDHSVIRNHHIQSHFRAMRDYWLFKFPFELHVAWIMAASVLNINVALVAWNAPVDTRLVVAWSSLFLVAGVALSFLLQGARLNGNSQWVVPVVMTWTAYAIARELGHPNELIVDTFQANDIHTVKVGAFAVTAMILLALHVKVLCDYLVKRSSPPLSEYMAAYHRIEEIESSN
jgi:translocator protein